MAETAIYLDHNATTPLLPAAAEAMRQAWADSFANPASQHGHGRAARRTLEAAREEIVSLLGGDPTGRDPDRLVFTSGGTESNSLVMRGMLAGGRRKRLVVSAIEHPSVAATADHLSRKGVTVHRLGVDGDGLVHIDELRALLASHASDIGLVSVMAANNETGVIQRVGELAELCRKAGVPMHTDASQAVGKLPVRFRLYGMAAMTFTAHKFHGPLGIGGLLLAPGVTIKPMFDGGFQQGGVRPGTESAPLAVGMLAALRVAMSEKAERQEQMRRLRDRLEARLVASWPGAVVLGGDAPRLRHTTCVAFPGANRQAMVMAYDLAGVACSTGSACASGSSEPSPTLLAMGVAPPLVEGAVRFSLGATTTEEEVEEAALRIERVHAGLLRGGPPKVHAG